MARQKFALCVGINSYVSAPLFGCVNDAQDWAELLRDKGYTVVVLLDESASKENIMRNLRDMLWQLKWGDRFVFTFSGHGSWIPDMDADEPDGRDEVLCAYDYQNGGLITDDEIQRITEAKRTGVRCTIFSDSCHSGSVSRFANKVTFGGFGVGVRFLSPLTFLTDPAERSRARSVTSKSVTTPRNSTGAVLFSGCADEEFSYDAWFLNRANGAFTRAAIDRLKATEQLYAPTYGRWHRAVRDLLPSPDYPQSPQMYASLWQRRWTL